MASVMPRLSYFLSRYFELQTGLFQFLSNFVWIHGVMSTFDKLFLGAHAEIEQGTLRQLSARTCLDSMLLCFIFWTLSAAITQNFFYRGRSSRSGPVPSSNVWHARITFALLSIATRVSETFDDGASLRKHEVVERGELRLYFYQGSNS